ncbi:hypothetical protein SAMN05421504_104740 [Amycolatopsis xylanica]|uniref:Uncharacterized protein n=1 Tax=Amycolatopsis xylanica TaxID=589385 RepID=A0A1H3HMZ8_9PSEU|nr:hypothetical protein [Amycolatopsis xylanica]SDY16881.1 hypothetical protein SAMN05421504_104740 [Amycolatopsis xylanica]
MRTVLIMATSDIAEAVAALGGRVLSVEPRLGATRAEVPAAKVKELAALESVTHVQVDEDIQRDEPKP